MSKKSIGKCKIERCLGTLPDSDPCPENTVCNNATCSSKITGQYANNSGFNTVASGFAAHSEGSHSKACAANSHAQNYKTKACGENSTASGYLTSALGKNSSANGMSTKASGAASATFGANTLASGHVSFACGLGCDAKGNKSFTCGGCCVSLGDAAHSEGLETEAQGLASHSEGASSVAVSKYSHAGGYQSIAKQQSQWSRASGMFCMLGDAQTTIFHLRGSGFPTRVLLTLDGADDQACDNIPIVPLGHTWSFQLILAGVAVPPPCPPNTPGAHLSYSACLCGLAQREACNDVTTVLLSAPMTGSALTTGLSGSPTIVPSDEVPGGILVLVNTPSTYSNWFATLIISQVGSNLNNIPVIHEA